MLLSVNTLRDIILDELKTKKILQRLTSPVFIIDNKQACGIIRSSNILRFEQK